MKEHFFGINHGCPNCVGIAWGSGTCSFICRRSNKPPTTCCSLTSLRNCTQTATNCTKPYNIAITYTPQKNIQNAKERYCTGLKQKFQTYKQYFHTFADNPETELPAGILFVIETRRREQGIQRRWHNILSAFYSVLFAYSYRLNGILTTIDQAAETILFERERGTFENEIKNHITQYFTSENEEVQFPAKPPKNQPLTAIAFNGANEYRLFLCDTAHEYESAVYRKYMHFYERQLPAYKKEKFKYRDQLHTFKDYEFIIFYPKYKPHIIDSFEAYKLDVPLAYKLSLLAKTARYHSFDPILNAPVTY